MDNYIYYRVLNHLMKYGTASNQDIMMSVRSYWKKNPIPFLLENNFIQETEGEYRNTTHYKLTHKGIALYKLMEQFYSEFDDLFRSLNKRLHVTIQRKGY